MYNLYFDHFFIIQNKNNIFYKTYISLIVYKTKREMYIIFLIMLEPSYAMNK
jgi:hypothetical protein